MKRPSKNDETSLGVYSLKVKGGRHGLMEVVDEDPFFNHSFILVFDTLIDNESDAVQALHHAAQPVYAGPIYTRDLVDRRIRKLAMGRPSLHYRPFAYTGPVDSERDVRDFSGSLYRPLSPEETVPPRRLGSFSVAIFVEASEIANELRNVKPWHSLLNPMKGDLSSYFSSDDVRDRLSHLDALSCNAG